MFERGAVAQCLSTVASQQRVPGLDPAGLSVWSLHVLPVYAWVPSGFSGFLPPSKNMHVRLTGDSKSECELGLSDFIDTAIYIDILFPDKVSIFQLGESFGFF